MTLIYIQQHFAYPLAALEYEQIGTLFWTFGFANACLNLVGPYFANSVHPSPAVVEIHVIESERAIAIEHVERNFEPLPV
jgi:hypothetical protein